MLCPAQLSSRLLTRVGPAGWPEPGHSMCAGTSWYPALAQKRQQQQIYPLWLRVQCFQSLKSASASQVQALA